MLTRAWPIRDEPGVRLRRGAMMTVHIVDDTKPRDEPDQRVVRRRAGDDRVQGIGHAPPDSAHRHGNGPGALNNPDIERVVARSGIATKKVAGVQWKPENEVIRGASTVPAQPTPST